VAAENLLEALAAGSAQQRLPRLLGQGVAGGHGVVHAARSAATQAVYQGGLRQPGAAAARGGWLVSLITTLFESQVEVQRAAIGQGAKGGTTQVWPPAGGSVLVTGVPCSYQESSANLDVLYGQRNDSSAATIFTDIDILGHVNDRAIVTSCRTGEVVYLLITGNTQSVARGRLYQTQAIRIQAPKPTGATVVGG
jgi:hypothetical protein